MSTLFQLNALAPNMRQVIVWTNDVEDLRVYNAIWRNQAIMS